MDDGFQGLAALIREVRQAADFLLKLPEKLVASLSDAETTFHKRRERIIRQKEIAELREVAKSVQQLYFWKGDFIAYAKGCIGEHRVDDVRWLKEAFADAAVALADFQTVLRDTYLSNSSLSSQALTEIARARRVYELLSELPEEDLLADQEGFLEVCQTLENLQSIGSKLIQDLDQHRKAMDFTYGD